MKKSKKFYSPILKGSLFRILLTTLVIFSNIKAAEPGSDDPNSSLPEKPGWKLTFNDEFNGSELDTQKWFEYYRDTKAVYEIRDGFLNLKIEENTPQPGLNNTFRVSGIATSSAIGFGPWENGQVFAQEQGWWECRCQTSAGSGRHCAFWLLPVDGSYRTLVSQGGTRQSSDEAVEIDIFEQLGREPTANRFTAHFHGPDGTNATSGVSRSDRYLRYNLGFDQTQQFATYALEWTANELIWYLNGQEVFRSPKTAKAPFYILLDIYEVMPSTTEFWTGLYEPQPYPREFLVDYVRVYEKETPPGAVIIADKIGGEPPLTVHFDGSQSTVDEGSIVSYEWNFGDGTSANGATVSHTYEGGAFEASLKITSDTGLVSKRFLKIDTGDHVTLQAEMGLLNNASKSTTHSGFRGQSFVNLEANESFVEWSNVNGGKGGEVVIDVRYALGSSAPREVNFIVNGQAQPLQFTDTGGWAIWEEIPVTANLLAGSANTIRIETTGQDAGNLDQISFPITKSTTLKAEQADLTNATLESSHAGFNDGGFINLDWTASAAQWNEIDGGIGGDSSLIIRYALGATNNRTTNLSINGQSQTMTFTPTGGWDQWAELRVPINLNQGPSNQLQISTFGQDSGNIDEITVFSAGRGPIGYTGLLACENWGTIPTELQDPEDDPDRDGLSNVLESLLGSSPATKNNTSPINYQIDNESMRFSYPKSSFWVRAVLEQSTDLKNWTPTPNSTEYFNASTGKYFYDYPIDIQNHSEQFFRVKFTNQ